MARFGVHRNSGVSSGSVPFRILGPVVANLEPDHEVIVRATDFLFQGF